MKPKLIGNEDLETLLLSEKYLTKWIALSMSERAEKVRKIFGVIVHPMRLRSFYLRNSIRFRRT